MATTYDLMEDYGSKAGSGYISFDPHWIICVVRQGAAESFDRRTLTSVDNSPAVAVEPRRGAEKRLVIVDDCTSLTLHRLKKQHTKSLSAVLRGGRDYMSEVYPGDWVFLWMTATRSDHERVLKLVEGDGRANNQDDGLKFVGRVDQMRKRVSTDGDGRKHLEYNLDAVGFSEFDSRFFYDLNVATNDVIKQNLGSFLTRIGANVDAWLGAVESKDRRGNINYIIPHLIDLILGKGVATDDGSVRRDLNPGADSGIVSGRGSGADEGAPNAYVIPSEVAKLLGNPLTGQFASYRDILELLQGVQSYENKNKTSDPRDFLPSSAKPLLGTFYPTTIDLLNKPIWSVLTQYLNRSVNEMYTCLRVAGDGLILPHIVLRQIPFTTDAFRVDVLAPATEKVNSISLKEFPVTRFSSLPRWLIDGAMVWSYDVGRSDAMRTNLVHVYGVASSARLNWSIGRQMGLDPPLVDPLDVMRSGIRSYMDTVDCAVESQDDRDQAKWIKLVADRLMGAHMTLNGTVETVGVAAPVAEGDNVQLAGVVYHIEGLIDSANIEADSGRKHWRTTFQLSNGMADTAREEAASEFPVYPLTDPNDVDPTGDFDPIVSLVTEKKS